MKSIAIVTEEIKDTSKIGAFPLGGEQIIKGDRDPIDVIVGEFGTDIILFAPSSMTSYDADENELDAQWSSITKLELIGHTTSMWCGGAQYAVYKKGSFEKEIKEEKTIVSSHGFGWCDKCDSYCFGDCEAN
jgi:hypothetical protein